MTEPPENYEWRETYFILFASKKRPSLAAIEAALKKLGGRVELKNLAADDQGRFESLMLYSPEDYAAIEINYETGEAVEIQKTELAKQLKSSADPGQLRRLLKADGRLDLMHFEQVTNDAADDGDEFDEMLDPTCLLMAVEALVKLTEGVAVDPASGEVMA
jgi:hypothetical protein